MWATGHAVNMERIQRWHLCECGMSFPCGLPIVVRLLVWPLPDSAFHWNSLRPGLNQTANSNWRGSPGHFVRPFAPFFNLKMAYYVKLS